MFMFICIWNQFRTYLHPMCHLCPFYRELTSKEIALYNRMHNIEPIVNESLDTMVSGIFIEVTCSDSHALSISLLYSLCVIIQS